jgi:hypothetical protein
MYEKFSHGSGTRPWAVFFLLGTVFSVLGCGSVVQHQTIGFKEETQLVLRGHSLKGAVVTISGGVAKVIAENDIQPASSLVFGVKRDADSKKDLVIFDVKAGLHHLEVNQNGLSRFSNEVFVSEGQAKFLEVPR